MFSWIPIIGPLIEGIVSVFNKVQDKQIAVIKTNADVDKTAIAVSGNSQASDRLVIRIFQDLYLSTPVIWTTLYGWDQIVAKKYPFLVWPILPWPPELAFMPYMVGVYLLGATGLILWKRK